MALPEADNILLNSSPDVLSRAISSVFRRLVANLLLDFENQKYHVVRAENKLIRDALKPLSSAVVEALFTGIGFDQSKNANSEVIYILTGDEEKIQAADRFLSRLEEGIESIKRKELELQLLSPRARKHREEEERRQQILQEIRRNAIERKGEAARSGLATSMTVMHPEDFSSVENLIEPARRTLLRTGRVRNCLFEGRHFTLRCMIHGRAYACKEGCEADALEAHWHLFTGKNLMYAYVAHLSQDASTLIHLGVEHGYQYNSLPGTKNFRQTVHFSAKRTNELTGALEYIDHPDRPSKVCIYCGVPFSELFL
ncbi:hypothetical protein TraAM80_07823 [Trypanosoma rangeli]|uniref:PUB domain-containing protein n=1 Tax=Trypanosoma rangeli TaxID=5698 RepID=A0A422N3Q8_TRYRA|nr:uncharacterized protein TraAM80_07823 [Trypanosoma rangeli]RNF00081.1 hypothetical protein TraAM80_07823 [Trypanosoma rangeli]|eukprot:RNF00081.1 hypothetical protein TraAM80_07823 [Trypanosoma rangeli]